MGNNVAKKLEAKYNIDSDNIEVKDLKNGKVQVFAVSDTFTKMVSPSLDEAKKETAIDMAKKQLDDLGIKYEMSGNKFKPFEAIYKPYSEDLDALYAQEYELTRIYQQDKGKENWEKLSQIREKGKRLEEFEDIIDLFNLGSAVKSSMGEAKFQSGMLSGKDFINAKLKNYPKAVAKVNQLIDMIGESKFTIEMAEWIFDFFNNAHFESPINEAKISHFKIGDVVELKTIPENLPYEIRKGIIDNKWAITRVSKSGRSMYSDIMEDVFGYDIELLDKKLKYKMFVYPEDVKQSMNEAKEEDKVDTITMDIPLFLRMLEYSKEDASQDMDLHDVTEKAISLGKERGILQMDDYDEIIGTTEELKEVNLKASKLSSAEYQKAKKLKNFKSSDWKWNADEDLYTKVNEAELTEAYVPSNIKEFAKRKGISSLVNKVAGWAEKAGKGIRGGTAIGKDYSTLVLDMTYQGGEIRINTDNDTITLYDEPVDNFNAFQRVYIDGQDVEENVAPNHDGKSAPYGSGYKPLEERIAKALDQISEELCPAGKAYRKRRMAAGEKSSAYLSGRAVKVCKGQMSGKKKKK
jgi:hypothetical protein